MLTDHVFETPILFLVFNRPDTTYQVFEAIKKIKPKYLYIASDGARPNIPGELDLVQETRNIINLIDWPCELKTLFREKNLGCKLAVSGAITWFFEQVELGIILEDDCLPNNTFFNFCEAMLHRYKNVEKVMMVNGLNPLVQFKNLDSDYFFSTQFSVWGWATWRRAWATYDLSLLNWKNRLLRKNWNRLIFPWLYRQYFELKFLLDSHHWDVAWVLNCLSHHGVSIVPSKNLIINIGYFGAHGVGKTADQDLPSFEMDCNNLKGPVLLEVCVKYDLLSFRKFSRSATLRRLMIYYSKQLGFYKLLKILLGKRNKK